jgi:hypothetical protein
MGKKRRKASPLSRTKPFLKAYKVITKHLLAKPITAIY